MIGSLQVIAGLIVGYVVFGWLFLHGVSAVLDWYYSRVNRH